MKNRWFNYNQFVNYVQYNHEKEDYNVGKFIVDSIRARRDFLIEALKYTNKTSLKKRHKNEIIQLTDFANTIVTSKTIKEYLSSIEYVGD